MNRCLRRSIRWGMAGFICQLALLGVAWADQTQSDKARVEAALEPVLARAAAYVAAFQQQLSGIVAEERYVQEVTAIRAGTLSRRTLKSDLLLTRPRGVDRYAEFRDVFEVDGRPVRDREDRLSRLFLDPSAANGPELESILKESARYNIGSVDRTLNTPLLSLGFLLTRYQPRFTFKRAFNRTPELAERFEKTFRVSTDVVVVEFRETHRDTLIRTTSGGDFPSQGRFWIEPLTGTVLISELVLSKGDLAAVVDVSYQSEPLLGFRVPVTMRERFTTGRETMRGTATYGRFRQFQVRTDTDIAAPGAEPGKRPVKPPPDRQ